MIVNNRYKGSLIHRIFVLDQVFNDELPIKRATDRLLCPTDATTEQYVRHGVKAQCQCDQCACMFTIPHPNPDTHCAVVSMSRLNSL